MSDIYHEGNRELQEQFDTKRLADRVSDIVKDHIDDNDRQFIERRDMFFLATTDEHGHTNCSYKGGEPGFVRVIDGRTIAFPNYDGNGMYLSMGNVLQTKQVGLLFIDFENQWRMRLNGEASIDADDPLMGEYAEAQFIVRVTAREVFPNCPRYIHKYQLVQRSKFVPKSECKTPVPSWKTGGWVDDVLPAADIARDPSREVVDR
jgi:predicted pyridoxine 5'-phosphate oxidase superfamily flavin-nucleotide-binding protein